MLTCVTFFFKIGPDWYVWVFFGFFWFFFIVLLLATISNWRSFTGV